MAEASPPSPETLGRPGRASPRGSSIASQGRAPFLCRRGALAYSCDCTTDRLAFSPSFSRWTRAPHEEVLSASCFHVPEPRMVEDRADAQSTSSDGASLWMPVQSHSNPWPFLFTAWVQRDLWTAIRIDFSICVNVSIIHYTAYLTALIAHAKVRMLQNQASFLKIILFCRQKKRKDLGK